MKSLKSNHLNWKLWGEDGNYYLRNWDTGKEILLNNKIAKRIYDLISLEHKYDRLSGKCAEKVESILRKFIDKRHFAKL
jgi:hypothetical protein